MKTRFLLLILSLFVVGKVSAETASGSYSVDIDIFGPRTIAGSISIDWDPVGKTYDLDLDYSSDGGAAGFGAILIFVEISEDGESWSLIRNHSKTGPAPATQSWNSQNYGSLSSMAATAIRVRVQAYVASSGLGHTPTPPQLVLMVGEEPPPPEYEVRIQLPGNPSTHEWVTWVAYQGEENVGEHALGPRDPPYLWIITGLESDAPVEVRQVKKQFFVVDGELFWTDGTTTTVLGQFAPTLTTETVPVHDVPPVPSVPDSEIPRPVDPPTAPEPTTPPTAPTPTTPPTKTEGPIPFGAFGSTAPVSQQDAYDVTDKTLEGLDAVSETVAESGQAVTSAVDKVGTAVWDAGVANVEATDKVASAVYDGFSKSISATGTVGNSVERLRQEQGAAMSQANYVLGEIRDGISALEGQSQAGEAEKQQIGEEAYEDAQEEGGTAASEAASEVSSRMVGVTISSTGPSRPSAMTVSSTYLGTVNLDPFEHDDLQGPIQWVKNLIVLVLGGLFLWWGWGQFTELQVEVSASRQAAGNTVAGSGGQVTALIAATAITAIILGIAATFFALLGGYAFPTNPFAGASGPVNVGLYLLYGFLPVPEIFGILTSVIAVKAGRAVIFATASTLIRFIVP